jgi:glutaminase
LGRRIRVYELAGALSFGTVEVVVRDVLNQVDSLDFVILDLERVTGSDFAAGDLLSTLGLRLAEREKRLMFTGQSAPFGRVLRTHLEEKSPPQDRLDYPAFRDIDFALEWCEDKLLSLYEPIPTGNQSVSGPTAPPEAFELLAGLEPAEKEALCRILRPRSYRAGDVIVKAGDPQDAIYLLTRGEATVVVPLLSGREKRLATLSAGMSFGEMAVLERSLRSATVYADQDAECHMVLLEDLTRLWEGQPRMKAVMLQNLASDLSCKLRKMNGVVRALAR